MVYIMEQNCLKVRSIETVDSHILNSQRKEKILFEKACI